MTTKPAVRLSGTDGNVFNIIGLVARALRSAGDAMGAKEFTRKAFASESYDAVLRLAMTYCEVS